jgi:hypothetical protein
MTCEGEHGVSRILEHEKGQVAGGWRILHNEELHNLYPPPYIIRVMGRHVARMVGMKSTYNILVGKPESKRLLETRRQILEDNIKVDNKFVVKLMHWIHVIQGWVQWRTVAKCCNAPWNSVKCW